MEIKVNKDQNNTYKIDVTVEKDRVEAHIMEALEHESKNVEVKGFRKGKAPLEAVKQNIDMNHLRSHAMNHIIEEVQKQVLSENKFTPIVYPRYEIKQFEEGKDLKLVMIIIEKPDIEIGDYKKAIADAQAKKLNAKSEPKEGETADTPQGGAGESKQLSTEEIIDAILSVVKIGISEQLINEETDRMMESMLKQLEQMGITLDKYLEAVNKKADEVRAEYLKVAERNIASDFALTEIAQKEGVEATDEDVAATIAAIPDEASREALSKPEQKMYIKAVLLKNKTLQKLVEAAAGDSKQVDTKETK
jgi:FKBP-type peptidyl-prolyl cis-trans isomerase (trigger factor)